MVTANDFFEALNALRLQTLPEDGDSHDVFIVGLRELRGSDAEACAAVMVEYAEANDDPGAWKFIAAAMNWYVEADRNPPFALTKAIVAALARWRGGESIAVVFGEKRGKDCIGARPAGLVKTSWKQGNALLVEYFMSAGLSQKAAAGKVAEWRANSDQDADSESIGTITKDHNNYKKK